VFAYADIDVYGNPNVDLNVLDVDSAMEISGKAAYVVTDGATLSVEAGWLDLDGTFFNTRTNQREDTEPAVGAGVILDIAF
jgi:hypothetical protein